MTSEDCFKYCTNCQQEINSLVWITHQMMCEKHRWFCQDCNIVIEKTDIPKHNTDFHIPIECECGASFNPQKINNHRITDCPKQLLRCEYCPMYIPADELESHKSDCENGLEPCGGCGLPIRVKELPLHACQPPAPSCPFCEANIPDSQLQQHVFENHSKQLY
jgi:hypothetical protein